MIVIDLGCATHAQYPEDESVNRLIERFHPKILYGFDPHPSLTKTAIYQDGCRVLLEPAAAWLYDGFIGYTYGWNPLRAYTAEDAGPAAVPCFDIARFIKSLPAADLVLKMDIEGSEYTLLPYIYEEKADECLSLALIEWHGDDRINLRCPIEEWS